MRKVTALRGFEWYPDGQNEDGTMRPRQVVLPGQEIEVSDEQLALLADHGHVEGTTAAARPSVPDLSRAAFEDHPDAT